MIILSPKICIDPRYQWRWAIKGNLYANRDIVLCLVFLCGDDVIVDREEIENKSRCPSLWLSLASVPPRLTSHSSLLTSHFALLASPFFFLTSHSSLIPSHFSSPVRGYLWVIIFFLVVRIWLFPVVDCLCVVVFLVVSLLSVCV